jgi:hypothetical protein
MYGIVTAFIAQNLRPQLSAAAADRISSAFPRIHNMSQNPQYGHLWAGLVVSIRDSRALAGWLNLRYKKKMGKSSR